MPLPELEPAIWTNIISFLHRPRDIEPDQGGPWYDLHQHDLATVCRVNVFFYEIATSLLYKKVIVKDFALFLRHLQPFHVIDNPPPLPSSLRSKVQTKEKLLARITDLHIINPEPTESPTMGHLLRDGNWDRVGEPEKERIGQSIDQCRDHLAKLRDLLPNLKIVNPFPKLERLILNHMDASIWMWFRQMAIYNQWDPSCEFGDIQEDFTKFVIKLRPKHLCIQASYGPLSLFPAIFDDFPKSTTITSHITEPEIMPPFVFGYENIVTYIPNACVAVDEYTGETTTNFEWLVERIVKRFDRVTTGPPTVMQMAARMKAKTNIRLYGPCNVMEPTTAEALGHTCMINEYGFKVLTETCVGCHPGIIKEREEMNERVMVTQLKQMLEDEIPGGWASVFDIRMSKDSPKCECCGYDLKNKVIGRRWIEVRPIPE